MGIYPVYRRTSDAETGLESSDEDKDILSCSQTGPFGTSHYLWGVDDIKYPKLQYCLFPDVPRKGAGRDRSHPQKDNDNEDGNEDDNSLSRRTWKEEERSTTIPIFTLNTGADPVLYEHAEIPTDFFLEFWNDEIMDQLVFQTNLYAVQSPSHFPPLQKNELYGFYGYGLTALWLSQVTCPS